MADPSNWSWRDERLSGGPAVVFDLDGVLADAWHRQHFLDGARRDWRSFFAACGDDPPIESTIALGHTLDPATAVVILTARPHTVHDLTSEWLVRHAVRWDLLIDRAPDDGGRTSSQFKRRTIGRLRDHGFELLVALDDDIRNVEMLHDEGVPAVYIHSGYYDRS